MSRRGGPRIVIATAALTAGLAPSGGLSAAAAQNEDSTTVVAGMRYGAGGLHRLLLGSDYRALWTAPIRVPVLDLSRFAGGLTPTRRGGGFQTKSLRFVATDGTEYAFRSVDKDPSSILPPALRQTLVDDVVQDQISSGHPVGALVAAPLLDAVGVLHPEPRLFVMPDDPRLGEFRTEFAGMLGMIEVRPDEGEDTNPGFMGATRVIGTERLLERIEEDLERVDARAFLSARLVDAFLGDWDRHRDQWRWARFGETRDSLWRPIPRDRDQAFVRLDGLLLTLARQYFPQLVKFDPSYPSVLGLTWNGRELDRRLLVELEWPAWDSVAAELRGQLTDDAIDRAVAQLPAPYAELRGEAMRAALRARREALPSYARRFYELLAGEIEVHTTDAPEIAEIMRVSDEALVVRVTAHESQGQGIEVYRRTLRRGETDELRLVLHGGADTVRVRGAGDPGIRIRIIGGGGDDVFADSSRVGGSRFYDSSGDNTFVRGNGAKLDERPYEYRGPPFPPSQPPRDWGRLYRYPLWVSYSPDVGLLAGAGIERVGYGFRTWPYASSVRFRAAFGTSARAFRAQLDARFNRENSPVHWTLSARASGLEILRFFGFGNETPDDGPDVRFEVDQQQFDAEARLVVPVYGRGSVSIGPAFRFTETGRNEERLIGEEQPYGSGAFGQVELRADLTVDGRDRERAPSRGVYVGLHGAVRPALLDVREAYGEAGGEARGYVTVDAPLRTTLAVRFGGRKVWGEYPFADAAFLGDDRTVRLGVRQRYAGDAEGHANAELRVRLGRAVLVLPADVGIFALQDVGRVWYGGEQSERWHRAAGGGVWLAFLAPANVLSLAVTRAEGRTGIYMGAGFAF